LPAGQQHGVSSGAFQGPSHPRWAHCAIRPDADFSAATVTPAIRTLEKALSGLAPSRIYDRSRALIELAEAHVTQRDVAQACAVLHDSLTLTGDVGLGVSTSGSHHGMTAPSSSCSTSG
jgi:hypothetical protein